MSFVFEDGSLNITPVKLPKHTKFQTLKYSSPKANVTHIEGRYRSKWYFMRDPSSMEEMIYDAVTWWNANATGEWQYRCEHAYAKIHEMWIDDDGNEVPDAGSFYYRLIVRHFIHYTSQSDILMFKLAVP